MDESNRKELYAEQREDLLSNRLSEATSDKVVSDLPKTDNAGGDNDSAPSPEGALDEPDEIKDAGPL
jgi:hypothetical protein